MAGVTELDDLLTPAERAALAELLDAARALLGPELLEARLFGSRARGEGNENSDLDVALVVSPAGYRRKREVQDAAFDAMLRHGITVAPLVVEERVLAELRDRERRFALELEADGIRL